jgi:opacity protein-like surface antigen
VPLSVKGMATAAAGRMLDALAPRMALAERTSSGTKIGLVHLSDHYRTLVRSGAPLPQIRDVGFRVFSQFDEDGILLFLLAVVGRGPGIFVDIGAGDGVTASNCANLALNLGFHGAMVDASAEKVRRAEQFYARHPDTSQYPPRCRSAMVTRGNVNSLILELGVKGEIDVLSIDIDGNDYWVWKAIECIQPRIVVVEVHVEFGDRSIVVPYDDNFTWQSAGSPYYAGASAAAMTKLAADLGYRLVGANRYGFNAFYLRNNLGAGAIPTMNAAELLSHPRSAERQMLFERIKDLPFVQV